MDEESKYAGWIACSLTLAISCAILKLLGMLTFPWWVVLSPIWIPIAIYAIWTAIRNKGN